MIHSDCPENSPKKAALSFIFITVLLDMLGIGMIIPILPKLVVSFAGGNSSHGAEIFGIFGAVWALMQFLFSPLLGALSDRFGRRPVILLSNFGLGLDYILMALAPSLGWLFAGRIVSGITSASVGAANAYIADITTPQNRAGAFGMLGAAFGLGFILGPALGGLLGSVDTRLPFWVAAALSLCNAAYGYFVLPESLPPSKRSVFTFRNANPIGSLNLLTSQKQLLPLAAMNFFNQLSHVVLPSTFVLYASYRYQWNERNIGLCLAGVGLSSMLVQAFLVRILVAKFGERNAVLFGMFFGICAFTVYGLAPTAWVFCCGVPLMALWGMTGPAIQSFMTQRVGNSEQGRLQGASGSITGIADMVGPLIFTVTFSYFIGINRTVQIPGAPFLLAAAFLACAAAVAFFVAKPLQAANN